MGHVGQKLGLVPAGQGQFHRPLFGLGLGRAQGAGLLLQSPVRVRHLVVDRAQLLLLDAQFLVRRLEFLGLGLQFLGLHPQLGVGLLEFLGLPAEAGLGLGKNRRLLPGLAQKLPGLEVARHDLEVERHHRQQALQQVLLQRRQGAETADLDQRRRGVADDHRQQGEAGRLRLAEAGADAEIARGNLGDEQTPARDRALPGQPLARREGMAFGEVGAAAVAPGQREAPAFLVENGTQADAAADQGQQPLEQRRSEGLGGVGELQGGGNLGDMTFQPALLVEPFRRILEDLHRPGHAPEFVVALAVGDFQVQPALGQMPHVGAEIGEGTGDAAGDQERGQQSGHRQRQQQDEQVRPRLLDMGEGVLGQRRRLEAGEADEVADFPVETGLHFGDPHLVQLARLGDLAAPDQSDQFVEGAIPGLEDGVDFRHVLGTAEKLAFDQPHLRPDAGAHPVGLVDDRIHPLRRFGEQQIVDGAIEPPHRDLDLEGGVAHREGMLVNGLGDVVDAGDALKGGNAEYPGQEQDYTKARDQTNPQRNILE